MAEEMQNVNKTTLKIQEERNTPSFFDVVIIGGGVIGSLISYRLSQYDFSVCLLEKEADLAMEETSANSAIVHAGYDPVPGSAKAKYNVLGNSMMEPLCEALHVPFVRNGSLVLGFTPEDQSHLSLLLERGKANGVEGLEMLSPEQVLKMEPNLSPEILCALYAPTGGIVCPYELTLAASEAAYQNGVEYRFEHEVIGIRTNEKTVEPSDISSGARFEVTCRVSGSNRKHRLTCRFLINAAGAFSDRISAMAGDASFTIIPRRGEYMILDKTFPYKVSRTIFQTPSSKGKGVLVTATVDGNTLIGPNAQEIADPSDDRITQEGQNEIFLQALRSVPSLDRKWMIRSFAGIRSTPSTHDFIIGESSLVQGFFQAAGIESPGLTSAPAIAVEMERLITEAIPGKPVKKEIFSMRREPSIRFKDLTRTEQLQKIRENPLYAQVVCRCEYVTEAEIVDAIRRPLGARTVNGVKLRTRAGMGRCQSGFCLPRILPILAREWGVPEEKITLFGTGSEIIKGRTRYGR